MTDVALRFADGESLLLGYVGDFYALLRAIDQAMPRDATLYVEGTSIAEDVRQFLVSRQASDTRPIHAGTLYPKPETYHLLNSEANLAELRSIAERHAAPEIAEHLVVYRGHELLLTAYDTGHDDVYVARSLPAETVQSLRLAFGDALS